MRVQAEVSGPGMQDTGLRDAQSGPIGGHKECPVLLHVNGREDLFDLGAAEHIGQLLRNFRPGDVRSHLGPLQCHGGPEEPADVCLFVVVAPSHKDRVEFPDQLRRCQRYASPGQTPDLLLEVLDGLLPRVCVQRSLSSAAPDLALGQPELLTALLDLILQKFEALSDVDDPGLARMNLHAQRLEHFGRYRKSRTRFRGALAGHHPIVGKPRQLISSAPHLLIERSQQDIAEQG